MEIRFDATINSETASFWTAEICRKTKKKIYGSRCSGSTCYPSLSMLACTEEYEGHQGEVARRQELKGRFCTEDVLSQYRMQVHL